MQKVAKTKTQITESQIVTSLMLLTTSVVCLLGWIFVCFAKLFSVLFWTGMLFDSFFPFYEWWLKSTIIEIENRTTETVITSYERASTKCSCDEFIRSLCTYFLKEYIACKVLLYFLINMFKRRKQYYCIGWCFPIFLN